MPTKTAETDPAAIKGWVADARKKPISFALLVGPGGLIMQADKVKSPEQMRKLAKAAGGTKGCWGTMEVQQKTLVLTYEGNPPGGFDKQIRKLLSDAGAAMRVEMISLADAGAGTDTTESAEDPDAGAAASDGQTMVEISEGVETETGSDDAEAAGEGDPDTTETEDEADGEEDVTDLPTVLKLARKRPLNFACMLADQGVVLVTHRRKQTNILVKTAKGAGGSAKGGWGTLTVEGKVVVLTCVEDPPASLARRLKLHLRASDLKYAVALRSPSGEVVEPEEDADEAPGLGVPPNAADMKRPTGAPGDPGHDHGAPVPPVAAGPDVPGTPKAKIAALLDTYGPTFSQADWQSTATSLDAIKTMIDAGEGDLAMAALEDLERTMAYRTGDDVPREPPLPLNKELARAENAVNRARPDMTPKQETMFKKLLQTAREQYSGNPAKASATLKLVMQKLDGLGLPKPQVGPAPVELIRAPENPQTYVSGVMELVSDERKAEMNTWLQTYGEYDNAWQLGDDEGGEYLAEVLTGKITPFGDMDEIEKIYLAKEASELWRDKDGLENRFEARWDVIKDKDARRALAIAFASHEADTTRMLRTGHVVSSIEGSNADSWMMNEAVSLDPAGALKAFHGMEGELARLTGGAPGLFAMQRQEKLLGVVNRGEIEGDAADRLVTSLFMTSRPSDVMNKGYRESLSVSLSKVATPDPEKQEGAAQRLDTLFEEGDVRDMMFGEKVPPELRNWALAQAANDPEWTAENMADGWESEFIAQKMAGPIAAQYEARGTDPKVLATGKDDREALRNTLGQALNLPPDVLPPEGETEAMRKLREAKGLNHKYYKSNKQLDDLANNIAEAGGDPAKMSVIPIVVTSNEFGVANFTVFRVEREGQSPKFIDNIGGKYETYDLWRTLNELPPGKMTFPEGLLLGAKMITVNTPTKIDTIGEWIGVVGDAAALTAGIAIGIVAIASTGGLSTPLVVAGAAAAGWQVGRAGGRLADDHNRGRDITDLNDPNVRANWLDAGAGALSIGALGAVAAAPKLAGAGARVSSAAARTTAGLQMASNTADALAMGNQAHSMHANWDKMSAGDKASGLLSIAFWGGMSAVSTKAGGALMRDATSFSKLRNQAEFGSVFEVKPHGDLSPQQIRVAYDGGVPGTAPSNVRIETGGGDIPTEILDLHTNVGRQIEFTGRMKAQLDSLLSGRPDPPSGTAAWEAKLEIQKIDAEGELLRLKLEAQGSSMSEAEIGKVRARQDELATEAQFQKGRLDQWAAQGEGWIASAETGNSWAEANNLPVGDDMPAGHTWVLRGDPPPHLRCIDPAVKKMRWDETGKAFVEADAPPVDIDALIAEARSKVANTDAPPDTSMTAEQGASAIEKYRADNDVTSARGNEGTVAATQIGDETIIGVNSTNFTDEQRALAKGWEKKMRIPAGNEGWQLREGLYHAEAHTLMQVYMKTNGNPPKNLTIYIDKLACGSCRVFLPKMLKEMGIETLTIVEQKRGGDTGVRKAIVTPRKFTKGW